HGHAPPFQFVACTVKYLAAHTHASSLPNALASEDLHQFFLAVAGDTGDADNLARANAEARAYYRPRAPVAHPVDAGEFEIASGGLRRCPARPVGPFRRCG